MIGQWLEDAGSVMTTGLALAGCLLVSHAVTGAVLWTAGRRYQARWFVRTATDEAVGSRVSGLVPGQREPS